ncbi:hypothetical protein SteCoe_24643 [Stentor coeruleus]|uniref:HSF-type DNA-binding domain-containing protein n=1 Tax=Stentor coeruleus TaxID=5963 RepID=A0A1R2BH52_9CILI|nr:hypothetical protein SteCoe_24643 [Stentor coeruleus]
MNFESTQIDSAGVIIRHLKEASFKPFINWKGQMCCISNMDLFASIVLPTLNSKYTIESFTQLLRSFNISFKKTNTSLKIICPEAHGKLRSRSRSQNPIMKSIEEIEIKQDKLYSAIARTQEKLERALKINRQIKFELKKSEEFQKRIILSQIEQDEAKDMKVKYVDKCYS